MYELENALYLSKSILSIGVCFLLRCLLFETLFRYFLLLSSLKIMCLSSTPCSLVFALLETR